MLMLVAVHQPNFLPRAKVLQKLAIADTWVVLDDVQFARQDYQHRAHITPERERQQARWCTLPVSLPSGRDTRISDVRLAHEDTVQRVDGLLRTCFLRGDRVNLLMEALSDAFRSPCPLPALGIAGAQFFLGDLAPKEILLASDLRADALPRSEGIRQLCKSVDATAYIADSGASRYLDDSLLQGAGISVLWQVWTAPELTLPEEVLRNGSAMNIWARDPAALERLLATCQISRVRARAQ
jgi:hypothetical protein